MKASDMHPSLRIALRNYGMVLVLMAIVAAYCAFAGDPPNLVALKLFVVPLWWLALGGLDAIYRQPIVESRWTLRAVEHTVLGALLFVVFMTVTTWNPEVALSKMLRFAGTMAVSFTAFRVWELRGRIRQLQNAAS